MDIFGIRKFRREMRALREQHDNLIHLVVTLAKQAGISVVIHEPSDGSATIALVKDGDNIVNFQSIRPSKEQKS